MVPLKMSSMLGSYAQIQPQNPFLEVIIFPFCLVTSVSHSIIKMLATGCSIFLISVAEKFYLVQKALLEEL